VFLEKWLSEKEVITGLKEKGYTITTIGMNTPSS